LREGQSILTTGVYERPPSERPSHDTLEGIAAWLIGPARQIASAPQAFDEYAWRLYAAGLPVLRVTLHCGTLHPQFLGSAYVWWRNTAQTQEIMVMHEVVDVVPYEENLVARVRTGGETVRRRAVSERLSVLADTHIQRADRRERAQGLSRSANRPAGLGRQDPPRHRRHHQRGAVVVRRAQLHGVFRSRPRPTSDRQT
jgi:hypothetical protein